MNPINNTDNLDLKKALNHLNKLLAPVEKQEMDKVKKPKNPNLLLIGNPRIGSTLFTQWAAELGSFSYPSNFLSRFYRAPYIGALIYNIVTNPEYRYKSKIQTEYKNEFNDIDPEIHYSSNIGKTYGFMQPHEFWYFWRDNMKFPEIPFSEEEFSEKFDFERLNRELALIQKAFGKPFLFKGKIANWYLKSLEQKAGNFIYIHMHRDLLATSRSLLMAREKIKGNQEEWISWKPREYPELIKMDKYHQVAGQIYFIEKEVLSKKEFLGKAYMSFSYEEFCEDPKRIYRQIGEKIRAFNPSYNLPEYKGKRKFSASKRTSNEDRPLKKALDYFTGKYGELKF